MVVRLAPAVPVRRPLSHAVIGGWTPAKLTGLLFWQKADAGAFKDAGTTLAGNGDTVQQWNDQSGNGNHLVQATAGKRPTFNTGVQNSLPGLAFVSANSQILSSTAALNLGGTTASVFIVAKGSTPGANARLVNFEATGDANDFGTTTSAIFLFYSSTTNMAALRNNVTLSNGTITNATFFELGSIFDGVNNTVYINNASQTAAASASTFGTTGKFNLCGAVAGGVTAFADATILEIFGTSSAIGSADRTNIHTYFSGRWGV